MTNTFLADDGCEIAFDFLPAADRPALLCSPSLGTTMDLFAPQVEALSGRFAIVRYDARGHGRSGVPAGSYSLDRLGRDAIGLLDHLGIHRAHFLGVSLGGMIGQWLGYRAAERLASLTLANTSAYMGPPNNWNGRIEAVRSGGMRSIADAVVERWFTDRFLREHADIADTVRSKLLTTDPGGYAGCCAAIRDMDLRPTAPLIAVPTLVIGGRHDPATPPEHARFLANAINGAILAETDAAHLANLEDSDAFNAALIAFLEAKP